MPLAPARVLSIAARAHAKSLHALWPIRAPTCRLRQSERCSSAALIRTRELSSRLTGQRRSLTHFGASRLYTHASRNITSKAVFFQYKISSPLMCLWPSCHSLLGLTTSRSKFTDSYIYARREWYHFGGFRGWRIGLQNTQHSQGVHKPRTTFCVSMTGNFMRSNISKRIFA